jgi:hypothetical protein
MKQSVVSLLNVGIRRLPSQVGFDREVNVLILSRFFSRTANSA